MRPFAASRSGRPSPSLASPAAALETCPRAGRAGLGCQFVRSLRGASGAASRAPSPGPSLRSGCGLGCALAIGHPVTSPCTAPKPCRRPSVRPPAATLRGGQIGPPPAKGDPHECAPSSLLSRPRRPAPRSPALLRPPSLPPPLHHCRPSWWPLRRRLTRRRPGLRLK